MKTISTKIEILASPKKVWDILMNFNEYPNWNPFIKKIEGAPIIGNKIKGTLKIQGKKPMSFQPKVLVNNKEKEFRWIGHLFVKGFFDGEHYFEIKEVSADKVEFIHGEEFKGVLASTLFSMIGMQTKQAFESMNKALKQQAEK